MYFKFRHNVRYYYYVLAGYEIVNDFWIISIEKRSDITKVAHFFVWKTYIFPSQIVYTNSTRRLHMNVFNLSGWWIVLTIEWLPAFWTIYKITFVVNLPELKKTKGVIKWHKQKKTEKSIGTIDLLVLLTYFIGKVTDQEFKNSP